LDNNFPDFYSLGGGILIFSVHIGSVSHTLHGGHLNRCPGDKPNRSGHVWVLFQVIVK